MTHPTAFNPAHVADGHAMPDNEPAVIDLQQYAVVFDCPDTDRRHVWGPFVDLGTATKFAEFATAEVDPAHVTTLAEAMARPDVRLLDPVAELLAWRMSVALQARLDGLQRAMAAPLPGEGLVAAGKAADRAMAERIHRGRPGVPLHHVFAVLESLRVINRLDAAARATTAQEG
jgi:hypothetical protein